MRPAAVVIVGTGQVGFQVAASLREEGFDGRVVLVGDEPDLPCQCPPPLSKAYLTGKADAELVRLQPDMFFAKHRLEMRLDERVTDHGKDSCGILAHRGLAGLLA